jgi:hypothetical protein
MIVDKLTPELLHLVNNFWRLKADAKFLNNAFHKCYYYGDNWQDDIDNWEDKNDFLCATQMAMPKKEIKLKDIKIGYYINDGCLEAIKEKLTRNKL